MTDVEARRFLNSIREQDKELEKKLVQIAELRSAVENCTSKLDKDGSQMSKGGDKLSNLMCKILDLEKECENLRINADWTLKTVKSVLDDLTQVRHKDYLMLRFVERNGIFETAMKMDVSDSTAKRIDKKAVSEFAKIYTKRQI